LNSNNGSLPYNEDGEKGVLCSLILAPAEGLEICARRLRPEHFYSPAHRIIYEALCGWLKSEPVDFFWLKSQLKKSGHLDELGGPEFLVDLFGFIPTGSNIKSYIDGVLDGWRRRSVILEYQRRCTAAYDDREPVESFDPDGTFAPIENGLPPFETFAELSAVELPEPAVVIEGLLHVGSKLSLGGASKSYKTWGLIDLGLSVAAGHSWLGHKAKQGRVLYINLELQKAFFKKRTEAVATAKGLPLNGAWQRKFVEWNLRGYCVSSEALCTEIIRRARNADPFALIIIDPLYKILSGKEENSNDQIAVLLNLLERVAHEAGAAVAYGQHFSKGNQAAKESIDRVSGAGVFARDPDSILTLTRHEANGAYTVEATLRNFAPIESFVVRWEYPLFVPDSDLDPAKLKQPKKGGRSPSYSSSDLMECLGNKDLTAKELETIVSEQIGMSRGKFFELFREAKQAGLIHQCKVDGKWEAIRK
jgi:hypothetical protein